MKLWQQLRWRIVGSHLVVIFAGVTILLFTSQVVISAVASTTVEPSLIALTRAESVEAVEQATADLLQTFRHSIFFSLLMAALGALVIGLITSVLLTRGIIQPLEQIAESSQRIANGHYGERVTVPESSELALVATNFNQMARALEQVERQRIALIGNVSHELRTPLTGIEGYLQGMMDGLLPTDTETFAQMYQEVRRLRRLVNDLQALSKVEAGQISLQLHNFDLIPLIDRIVTQLQPQATAQALEIISKNLSGSVNVYADPDRTAQVLLNLIGNAIRYTPEGGQITVSVALKQRVVEVRITDTGVGIPLEALPYIFERFYRVDRSRARASGGSGIGLTISRHLAWAMGGELTAASDGAGKGSTFLFVLPRAMS